MLIVCSICNMVMLSALTLYAAYKTNFANPKGLVLTRSFFGELKECCKLKDIGH